MSRARRAVPVRPLLRAVVPGLALGLVVAGAASGLAGPAGAAAPAGAPAGAPTSPAVASAGPRTPSDPGAQLTTAMMPPTSPDAVHAAGRATAAAHAALAPAADTAYLQGVDVASYQHPSGQAITWTAVRASGRTFAVVKATEGTTYTNSYLAGDAAGARAAGLSVGVYHFARPGYTDGTVTASAVAQADNFAAAITAVGGAQLPPTLDLESSGGLTPSALVAWTAAFLARVQVDTARRPMIYTGPYFWDTALGGSTAFTGYPLWEAHYTSAAEPEGFGGWAGWTFWQYSDGAYGAPAPVPGIAAVTDRDRYVGSAAGLASLTTGSSADIASFHGTASSATYPDGSFVQLIGSTQVWEVAGLAPVYVPSWSLVGGPHPVRQLTPAQFQSLRAYPADGTFLRASDTNAVFRVAGGAPMLVTSWATVGGVFPTLPIGAADVAHAGTAGAWAHLRGTPLDGTFLNAEPGGTVYRVAGGAPIVLTSWSYFGGLQHYTTVSAGNVAAAGATLSGGISTHLDRVPVDGTALVAAQAQTHWTVLGGRLVPVDPTGLTFVTVGDSAITNRGLPGVFSHLL